MAPPANILMVDDDPALLRSLRAGLGPGYTVRAAGTGEAALAALARDPVDLVFLADRLPDVPGIPLLRQIKERYHQVLVFLMTAAGSEDLVIACIDNGGRAYLRKPFDPAALRPSIEKLLAVRRENTERRIPILGAPAMPRVLGLLPLFPEGPRAPSWIGLTGQSGLPWDPTGKRHRRSRTERSGAPRRRRPPLRQC